MDKAVTLITGPYRSGTSMLTGLLESCGFDLGRSYRVLREPTEHNPTGHLEIDYIATLNAYILANTIPYGTYGGWAPLPGLPDARTLSGYCRSHEQYFAKFVKRFDGDLCKDPGFCLTLQGWRPYLKINKVVFSLRDPVSSARSMSKRYGIAFDTALDIWFRYTDFFHRNSWDRETVVFDLVAFYGNPSGTLRRLCETLGRKVGDDIIDAAIRARWSSRWIHTVGEAAIDSLPAKVSALYEKLRNKQG